MTGGIAPCAECGHEIYQSKEAVEAHMVGTHGYPLQRESDEAWLRGAAEKVRAARVRYSQEFQLAKARKPGTTDNHAHQIAIEQTKDELTTLEVDLEIAKRRLQ